jgi:anti-sigma regulatory factor (Ser/Thr protein kinase)
MSSVSVLHFPPSIDSPRRARHDIVALLHDRGIQEVDDVAALLTSELVTNSVMHASSDVEVCCEVHAGRVRVAVSDRSPVTPHVGDGGTTEESGRGVSIVSALADAWGTEATRDQGKSVWFELAVSAMESASDG